MSRLYRIEKALPNEETTDGVRIGLGYADRPTQFSVTVDERAQSMLVAFQYATDMQEAQELFEEGRVCVSFGRYSKRLFSARLRCPELFDDAFTADAAARALVLDLKKAFDALLLRNATAGSRLNYKAAQLGLDLDSSSAVPPAWLLDAIGQEHRSNLG